MVTGLTQAGVHFVVIGGVAARVHGSPRITEDLDICYDPNPPNAARLAELLAAWHAYPRGVEPNLPFIMDARTLKAVPVMTLTTDQGEIDLFDAVSGVGAYEGVLRASVEVAANGLRFRALDLPGLLQAKAAARRPKDLDQIPELEALLELRQRGRKGGG